MNELHDLRCGWQALERQAGLSDLGQSRSSYYVARQAQGQPVRSFPG
jgi:hypothetical protein